MVIGRDQTDLPAQHPSAQAQARFPRADEDAGGACDPEESASKGQNQAVRLSGAAMPNPRRLRSSRDFYRVFTVGSRARKDGVTVVVAPGVAGSRARLGLSVKTRRGAVVRNRIRRRVRAAIADLSPQDGYDIVVRSDDSIVNKSHAELLEDLGWALGAATRSVQGRP